MLGSKHSESERPNLTLVCWRYQLECDSMVLSMLLGGLASVGFYLPKGPYASVEFARVSHDLKGLNMSNLCEYLWLWLQKLCYL